MRPLYRIFADEVCPNADLDFSDEAAWAMFAQETYGEKLEKPLSNGYYVGKAWMDVQIAEWKRDLATFLLFRWELYEDPIFSEYHWWLDKVLETNRLTRSE